jgi:hypothetical protein
MPYQFTIIGQIIILSYTLTHTPDRTGPAHIQTVYTANIQTVYTANIKGFMRIVTARWYEY